MSVEVENLCGVGELHPSGPLRTPAEVMQLDRMGCFFPSRISFMRALLRDLHAHEATVDRRLWDIDEDGFGRAVYVVTIGDRPYSLVAFSTPLEDRARTDRVIAEAWDTTYVLYDGVPSGEELDRLASVVPRQEASRYTERELVLSRANRSVRLFDHVVESLSDGRQPTDEMVGSIGYLMRTTAVYGNGKFGIADRRTLIDRPCLAGPFRAEMLTVWLIRTFTLELVEHIAASRAPGSAAQLERRLQRHLGIGNATGLGMAPFLVNHPMLLNNWMLARETALARVRAVRSADADHIRRFRQLLFRARHHVQQWTTEHAEQSGRIFTLRIELSQVADVVDGPFLASGEPWDRLVAISSRWSQECGELLVSLLLELYPDLVDGLADCMTATEVSRPDPTMTVAELASEVDDHFAWAVALDFDSPANSSRFWYVSEDKLEPRLGDRRADAGVELESPLDIARRVNRLAAALDRFDSDASVADVLAEMPEHRHAVLRVQTVARHPYSELRNNLIGEDCRPLDMLRSKLSFFGASKFDPKSDRWTRVTLFQGAPLTDELGDTFADDWWLPVLDPA